ncbi:formimidoylglutamate deiminase [Roseovarius autotrophicus]|uniref:formimidoylglutamate deiminase n=1 Tax=Roseovarius autotrophicus TaxID=2824121 RepID=UPI0019F6812A|nr:formimidoylglutamate deiminase [Roseovarius autotrophicus]MBE0452537.1 formimidoylglutamate deiminase [Roseovarius sp.]
MTARTITALRIWAEQALLAGGWARDVAVTLDDAGRIAALRPDSRPEPGARRVGALLPAPANLHSHAFQRAMAGLTERRGPDPRDTFWTWRQLMFRFLDRLGPDDVQAITAFVQMQMLESGYAAVAEFHYLHHAPGGRPYQSLAEMSARVVAAAGQSGIGLTLLPVLYQYGGCDQRALAAGQIRFGNDPDRFARLVDEAGQALAALPGDARLGVAPHSLRAVSPEGLAMAVALRPDAPLHMHLAEQVAEVEEVQAVRGARPVEWLLDHAQVTARWCLIHCTQMQRRETLTLAATGAVAGLCPITESSLGDGIFDGVAWTGAGGLWGIGSDSNIRISLSEELRSLDYSQRLRDRSRAALATADRSTGRVLLESAARGGAKACGRDAGVLAVGKLADLVALDTGHVDLEGRQGDSLLDAFIFAADDRAVCDVWSAGRHLVSEGRHVKHDDITRAYRAVTRRLAAL